MIIGITGKATAGKDTAASHFIDRHGYVRYAMADPLKSMLRAIGVACDTQEEKARVHPVLGVTHRHLAQTIGTEWMRGYIKKDGWVLLAREAIRGLGPNIVIPDLRFDNEAEMVRRLGGWIINIQRAGTADVGNHPSEAGISNGLIDFQIGNNESIPELHSKLETVLRYTSWASE